MDWSTGSTKASTSTFAWAQHAIGLSYRDNGLLERIPEEECRAALQRLPESNDRWRDLAEWLSADPLARPIFPGASQSAAQIAVRERDFALRPFRESKGWSQQAIEESSKFALVSALDYDTTVPLARLLLANVLERLERAEEEAKRDAGLFLHTAHLREYDLDRLPDHDAHRQLAIKILNELPDAKVGAGIRVTTAREAAALLERNAWPSPFRQPPQAK